MVSDYSADAFLAALRRFVSRRGLPSDLYSDQGTTFTGADSKLRALFAAADKEGQKVLEGVEQLRINWHFNPPASPHFGGLWGYIHLVKLKKSIFQKYYFLKVYNLKNIF